MLEAFTWFRQAGYLWQGDGRTIYIDPWDVPEDQPPADVIFITHAHFDHYSPDDLGRLSREQTVLVAPHDIARELSGEVVAVAPGDVVEAGGVKTQVVPAYNVVEDRLDAHPKSNNWVGYILRLGDRDYFHAGDTDHLPELEEVRADVTFLPIGGSGFTMDAREAGALARTISPEVAVPMHYGGHVEGCGLVSDADVFRREAAPVHVEVLSPVRPFGEG